VTTVVSFIVLCVTAGLLALLRRRQKRGRA
jgi:hypothetical protein